jgi:hypothetical protein
LNQYSKNKELIAKKKKGHDIQHLKNKKIIWKWLVDNATTKIRHVNPSTPLTLVKTLKRVKDYCQLFMAFAQN